MDNGPDGSWEMTVTEDVYYGILHCEHIYYFVMLPNSDRLCCTSIIDGEQRLITDPDEIFYLLKKFGLVDFCKSRCFKQLTTRLMKVNAYGRSSYVSTHVSQPVYS